jgi:hypothetical protein
LPAVVARREDPVETVGRAVDALEGCDAQATVVLDGKRFVFVSATELQLDGLPVALGFEE